MECVNDISDSNKIYIDFFGAYLLILNLNLFIKLTTQLNITIWTFLSRGILAIFLLRALWKIKNEKKIITLFAIELIVSFIFLLSLIMGKSDQNNLFNTFINVIFVFIPMAFSIYCIDDFKLFLKRIYIWSLFCIAIIILFSVYINLQYQNQYFMSVGYALLFPVCFVFQHFFNEKRIIDLIIAIVGSILVLLYGSRGPLLCIAIYLSLIFIKSIDIKKMNTFKIFFLFFIMLSILFHKQIIMFVINLFNDLGFSSRTLYMFINEEIKSDSNRIPLYDEFIDIILKRPILGYGIMGGWIYGNGTYVYPHNIFLELLLSFGIPIGLVLCFIIVWLIIRQFFKIKNKYFAAVSIIFIASFTELFLSHSFLLTYSFYITIAIFFKYKKFILNEKNLN